MRFEKINANLEIKICTRALISGNILISADGFDHPRTKKGCVGCL